MAEAPLDGVHQRDLEIVQILTELQQSIADERKAELLAGLARRFRAIGRHDLSQKMLVEAEEVAHGLASVGRSRGLALFGQGDWKGGLEVYDQARWKLSEFEKFRRGYPQPAWTGEALDGKHILLWAEQGTGDQVMQARVLEPILRKGARITVESDPRLHPLIQRKHPQIDCAIQQVELDDALKSDAFDFQCSMLSAWRFVDLPKPQSAYLGAAQQYEQAFRTAWEARGWHLNVGLSWRSKAAVSGSDRSIPPILFRPLMERKDLTFHALQYDTDKTEIGTISRALGKPLFLDRDGDPLKDLDRQAAQIAALDLVISIDNATVHMAGALGVETWVLIPPGSDWRWGGSGEATDLYQSLWLVRNEQLGHWGPGLMEMVNRLAGWTSKRKR
jgi:hypothetical protein